MKPLTGRLKATFEDLGSLALKNIERPVQAFSVKWEPSDWHMQVTSEVTVAPATAPQAPLPLPDKPSIAVLPFQNMSGDPEQEYFADGMVEDIITALSRFNSLFVIARNSSFTYKGKAVDIKQVGRELGVRYVLEGSVRRGGQPRAHHGPARRERNRQPSLGRSVRRRTRGRIRPCRTGDREGHRAIAPSVERAR